MKERVPLPFAAELRKAQVEALKSAEALNNRRISDAKAAEALRKTYDIGYRNAQAYLRVEEQVARQVEARNLTIEQSATVLQGAAVRFKQMGDSAGAANQNVKLTASQMQGLGYQLNDIGTMLALGASPFQVIASQAGQIIQTLGDGPKGMKGSLMAIGASLASFARAIPASGYAVAGVTAAVGALWYATSGPNARGAEETIKDFENAIKRLETGWKGAAEAAAAYAKAPGRQQTDPNATFLDVQGSIGRLTKDYQAAVQDLNSSDLLSDKILRPFAGSVSDARREITTLYGDLRQGEISAQQLGDAMLRIRLDPNADVYARNFAEEIRLALPDVVALERRLQGLNQAAAQLAAPKGTMARNALADDVFAERFGPTIGADGRFGDSDGMKAIRDGLNAQTDAMEDATKEARTYADAVAEQRASLSGRSTNFASRSICSASRRGRSQQRASRWTPWPRLRGRPRKQAQPASTPRFSPISKLARQSTAA